MHVLTFHGASPSWLTRPTKLQELYLSCRGVEGELIHASGNSFQGPTFGPEVGCEENEVAHHGDIHGNVQKVKKS